MKRQKLLSTCHLPPVLRLAALLMVATFAAAQAGPIALPSPVTILADFDGTNGQSPFTENLVQGKDGNLYGTTLYGGANGDGTVFKVTPSGMLTSLHSFTGTDGENPYAGLVLGIDGNFYGTTYQGGTFGDGTVFKITPAGKFTTLHNFDNTDGGFPRAPSCREPIRTSTAPPATACPRFTERSSRSRPRAR